MTVIEHQAAEIIALREQMNAANRWWNDREIGLHQALKTETKRGDALAERLTGAVRRYDELLTWLHIVHQHEGDVRDCAACVLSVRLAHDMERGQ